MEKPRKILIMCYTNMQMSATRLFSLVCFRLVPPHNNEEMGNKLNRELLEAVNSTGKLFISHTVFNAIMITVLSINIIVGSPYMSTLEQGTNSNLHNPVTLNWFWVIFRDLCFPILNHMHVHMWDIDFGYISPVDHN